MEMTNGRVRVFCPVAYSSEGAGRDEIVGDRQHPGHARRWNARALQISRQRAGRLFARADVDVLADVDGAALRQVVGVEARGGGWKAAAYWSAGR